MLIQATNLDHIYMAGSPMQSVAIQGITMTIQGAELIGIIGHTGSGKSTLVQHLNGLLRATGGSIFIDGKEIPHKGGDMRSVRRTVGMVFQYPEYQLFEETVERDIAFGPKNLGMSEEQQLQRVKAAMQDVGLPYEVFAPRSPFELSGGQKRRVAIAGVLAMEPQVLVLDEPTAGLDPRGREEILQVVRLWHQRGHTVIMISHSMDDIAHLCSRVIVMSHGKIHMQGTPQQVFQQIDALHEIGLDAPAATTIARDLRANGMDLPEGIVTMDVLEEAIAKACALPDVVGGEAHGTD